MAAGRFTFPDPGGSSGGIEATRPHSQWRNRAGLAPDFPVMPLVGTQGLGSLSRAVRDCVIGRVREYFGECVIAEMVE
jgi:hypothetical protein